jgi:hypothetical protein
LYWEVLKPVLCQFCPFLLHFPYFIYVEDGLPFLQTKVKCAYFKINKRIITVAFGACLQSYQNCLLALPYLSVCPSIWNPSSQWTDFHEIL